jgi:hypothetical protein
MGVSLGSVRVHSLTLFCTPGNIRCDFWASFLVRNLASPCLGCEPNDRVVIEHAPKSLFFRCFQFGLTFESIKEFGSTSHCNPCQDLSNDMWHATYMRVNWGDFRLLVVESQIGSLNLGPSFSHNLCFKYANGSCEPILTRSQFFEGLKCESKFKIMEE